MDGSIRTLIVDDEPLVRERLKDLLKLDEDFSCIDFASNGTEAGDKILLHSPDVVFLDIQMPGKNGFEVVSSLPSNQNPIIVFITAFDNYSIQAFDVHAIDYLLKPVEKKRFVEMLKKVKSTFEAKTALDLSRKLKKFVDWKTTQSNDFLDKIPVKDGYKTFLIPVDQICFIKSHGNYLQFHVKSGVYTQRGTITNILTKLHPEKFKRIHKSTIVNANEIRSLHHLYKGEYELWLSNGARLVSSRTFSSIIQNLIGKEKN